MSQVENHDDNIWSADVDEPELEFDEDGIELAANDGINCRNNIPPFSMLSQGITDSALSIAVHREIALCQEEREMPQIRAGAMTPDGLIDEDFEQQLGPIDEDLETDEDRSYRNISKHGIVQIAGDDRHGRKIIAISACKLPKRSDLNQEEFLAFLKRSLDPYVENDYAIVYFHFGLNSENKPTFGWIRQAYREFDRKYKKNLKNLFIVHPSTVIRVLLRLFRPIISAKFGRKILYVNYLHELADYVDISQINIPNRVQENDKRLMERYKPQFSNKTIVFHQPIRSQQFGVSLQYMKERNNNDVIPVVVRGTIEYLSSYGIESPGLFRRSPNIELLSNVRKQIDEGRMVNFASFNDPNLAAATLKSFFRQLPEPVLTYDLYDQVLRIESSVKEDNKLEEVRSLLIEQLPDDNYRVLKFTIEFLTKVSFNREKNEMNSHNLGIVFGPNLLWHNNKAPDPNVMQCINSFTSYLIHNYSKLFVK